MARFKVGDNVRLRFRRVPQDEMEEKYQKLNGVEGKIVERRQRKDYNFLASAHCYTCGGEYVNKLDSIPGVAACDCLLEKPLPDSDCYSKSNWKDFREAITQPDKVKEPDLEVT